MSLVDAELVRLPAPKSYTGYVDISGELVLQLSWFIDDAASYPNAGTMEFVPTQGPLAGY